MKCRPACGACCIAPSINTPYYGMPNGKAAGERCVHLRAEDMSCAIWQSEHYPETCQNFAATVAFCGDTRDQALSILEFVEKETNPEDS